MLGFKGAHGTAWTLGYDAQKKEYTVQCCVEGRGKGYLMFYGPDRGRVVIAAWAVKDDLDYHSINKWEAQYVQ